ncbi:exocyst complex component 4-like isoform X2 [Bolinopsis microptera]|uniref:exocyst complex component 4-like isoform X2 n=1 Tax=Bolinopsis microptera TaxID=2820187 RepID=UPI0030797CEE
MSYLSSESENESHLLNVIVSLQAQELQCDVNRTKNKNISEFQQIDAKINEQLTDNHNALKQIPEVYSNVLDRIKFAQGKIKSCKEKIDRCKTSLQCQREDLKRLYLDSVTNGQILDLLARIDKVREVSGVLDAYIKHKHYQHATKLLKTNVALLEGNLSSVDALKDIKDELKKRKDTLHLELIQQLQNHLYLKAPSAKEKVQLFRSGEPPEMDNEEEYEDEEEDLTKDPEEDTYKFLKLLIQSLQQLDRLDETEEVLEKNMESELRSILNNTAQDLLYKKRLTNQIDNQPTLFPELLEECFAKYRAVAASHHVVINAIEHLRFSSQANRYSNSRVWSNIQTCVEYLLRDYLAVDEDVTAQTLTSAPISYVAAKNDMSVFFARSGRRPEKVQPSLFSFESSATGLTRSSECRTQQYNSDTAATAYELPALCQKSPHNITLVFKQITNFIREINNVINMTGTQLIPLQHFLNEFVDNKFLPTLQGKVKKHIAEATEGLNMVKLPSTKIGWPRPLLQGTLKVQEELAELRSLMNRMPKYCNKFLDIIYEVLKSYKKICHNTFSNIVGINVIGANQTVCHIWFKDEKLKQIIKELPAWPEVFNKGGLTEQTSTHAQLVTAISIHLVTLHPPCHTSCHIICNIASHMSHSVDEMCVVSPRSNVTSPFSNVTSPRSQITSPRSQITSPRSEISSSSSELTDSSSLLQQNLYKKLPTKHTTYEIEMGEMQNSNDYKIVKQITYGEDSDVTSTETSRDNSCNDDSQLSSSSFTSYSSCKDILDKDAMIADSERLIQLAQLQDSINWLIQYVDNFAENLQCDKELQDQLTGSNMKLLEDCRNLLNERMNELLQLAEDCLMILYLEIRVQCYYHLLIVLRKQEYKVDMVNSDPDSGVTLLNKFLSQLEEKIRDFLPLSHTKFLFEGLGYIMSSVIISNASYIKEINNGGLKKMSRNILALQQNLTNITLTHELELERARFYYELLYQKPEEILRNIVEQQKRFTKSEYVELIQLYYRSNRSSKNNNKRSEKQLNLHLVKLNEIMENESDSSSEEKSNGTDL